MSPSMNRLIDQSVLKADVDEKSIIAAAQEAAKMEFAALCVNPLWVPVAAEQLKGSKVAVCSVVGFPLGASCSAIKAKEAALAVEQGAVELDMVLSIGKLKGGHWSEVYADIRAVVQAAPGLLVKVILETCFLSQEELVAACKIAVEAGARFVKSSTGFGPAGATVDAIALMRSAVGSEIGVKASGGISTYQAALSMLQAGANRIGTSAGVRICQQEREALLKE